MNFTKMQGAGNDFILIEPAKQEQDWSQVAQTMCDRHFGIGADGLLLLLPSEVAHFQMREFNPDGSEAEACGNGLRCLAKYILDREMISNSIQKMLVETVAGVREVRLHRGGNGLTVIQVSLGKPEFRAKEIPVAIEPDKEVSVDIKLLDYPITIRDRELLLSFVSMGNPHAVYFTQEPVADFPLSQLGPETERHRLFPNRVNFEVANIINRQQIEARVWERGVGETLACGTGACAIAVIAQLHNYIDDKVDIKLAGGVLNIEWDGLGEVFLAGPTEIVFTGEWQSEVKMR